MRVVPWMVLLSATGCGPTSVDDVVAPPDCSALDREACVAALRDAMTLSEKIAQMHGSGIAPVDELYLTADNERLGIPGFRMVDGPRGVRAGNATAFPVGMARGASWDIDLEGRVGEAIAMEAAAKGANVLLAPTMNVLRHPAWGRAQETYGEDPMHLGAMASAFVGGAQKHLIASAKHFALNSIEDTRFDVDVAVDERTLREVYLPHFQRVVEKARVGSVMSAYNKVNGFYCAENQVLLRDILKNEWRFDGFVESDWILGTRSTVGSALAGLDIEMPAPLFYGPDLEAAVESGEVPVAIIDDAVARILRKKLEHRIAEAPAFGAEVVESEAHHALAREVADKSIVLLKNEGALPIDPPSITTVAVVGSLAALPNMGDEGSSAVTPSRAVSPLDGIEALLGAAKVVHVDMDLLSTEHEAAVAAADAAIVVVGLSADVVGENLGTVGGDRDSLALSGEHAALVAAVAALNDRTIVVLEGGAAITLDVANVEAVLMAWYPGQEGGHALASILFGDVSPSGKLPITFPVDTTQLPPFDNQSLAVTYGYDHGYRLVDRMGADPLFPFGFGLSYASFTYDALALSATTVGVDDTLVVTVEVTNTSSRAGDEVVQAYVSYPGTLPRPVRALAAFARVSLAPAETKSVELNIPVRDLGYYDSATQRFELETGAHRVLVGSSSRDLPLEQSFTIR